MKIRHSFFMPSLYKIHPSPSSSSSSSSSTSPAPPHSAVINLLPPGIQSEVSDLPLEDLEVLAYLMKRSLSSSQTQKKPPSYDFELYGSFWNRWDSSSNRNLISKAIDAFEESLELDSGAGHGGRKSGGKKKKERKGKRGPEKRLDFDGASAGAGDSPEIHETGDEVALLPLETEEVREDPADSGGTRAAAVAELVVVRGGAPAADINRGLARKVLPDVVGIFHSRLWNLWRPKV